MADGDLFIHVQVEVDASEGTITLGSATVGEIKHGGNAGTIQTSTAGRPE